MLPATTVMTYSGPPDHQLSKSSEQPPRVARPHGLVHTEGGSTRLTRPPTGGAGQAEAKRRPRGPGADTPGRCVGARGYRAVATLRSRPGPPAAGRRSPAPATPPAASRCRSGGARGSPGCRTGPCGAPRRQRRSAAGPPRSPVPPGGNAASTVRSRNARPSGVRSGRTSSAQTWVRTSSRRRTQEPSCHQRRPRVGTFRPAIRRLRATRFTVTRPPLPASGPRSAGSRTGQPAWRGRRSPPSAAPPRVAVPVDAGGWSGAAPAPAMRAVRRRPAPRTPRPRRPGSGRGAAVSLGSLRAASFVAGAVGDWCGA